MGSALRVFSLWQFASEEASDEYLQATILSVDSGRVEGSMWLVPGVAVSSAVITGVDTNRDGTLSEAEQQAYAQRVLRDLLLKIDGQLLALHLVASCFPSTDSMRQGTSEIQLEFTTELPAGGSNRRLTFENHHLGGISVYLVNTLVPHDKRIQIAGQSRNENQSVYQVDFVQRSQLDFVQNAVRAVRTGSPSLSGFAGAFHLGVRHIAEGTDHLLFLLALLLPAPLLASAGRWCQRAAVGHSLIQGWRLQSTPQPGGSADVPTRRPLTPE